MIKYQNCIALVLLMTSTSWAVECDDRAIERLVPRASCDQAFGRHSCEGVAAIVGSTAFLALKNSTSASAHRYSQFLEDLDGVKSEIARDFKTAQQQWHEDQEKINAEYNGKNGKLNKSDLSEPQKIPIQAEYFKKLRLAAGKIRLGFVGDSAGPSPIDTVNVKFTALLEKYFPGEVNTKWNTRESVAGAKSGLKKLIVRTLQGQKALLYLRLDGIRFREAGRNKLIAGLFENEKIIASREFKSSAEKQGALEERIGTRISVISEESAGLRGAMGGIGAMAVAAVGGAVISNAVVKSTLGKCSPQFGFTEKEVQQLSQFVTLPKSTATTCSEIEIGPQNLLAFIQFSRENNMGVSPGICKLFTDIEQRLATHQEVIKLTPKDVSCSKSGYAMDRFTFSSSGEQKPSLMGQVGDVDFKVNLVRDGNSVGYGEVTTDSLMFRRYLGQQNNNNMENLNRDRELKANRLNPRKACDKAKMVEPFDRTMCEIAKKIEADRMLLPLTGLQCPVGSQLEAGAVAQDKTGE